MTLGVGFAMVTGGSGIARAASDSGTSDSSSSSASDSSSSSTADSTSDSPSGATGGSDAGETDEAAADDKDVDEDSTLGDDAPTTTEEDPDEEPVDPEGPHGSTDESGPSGRKPVHIVTDNSKVSDPTDEEVTDVDADVPSGLADDDAPADSVDAEESTTPQAQDTPVQVTTVTVSHPAPADLTETVELASAAVVPLVDPIAPAAPSTPTIWTMLGLMAREIQRTWLNRRPHVDHQQVDVTLDEFDDVSDPIAFGGTDADGDALTYWTPNRGRFLGPRHGTVTIDQATGSFTYNPDDAFALSGGKDRFLVRVSDYGNGFHLHGLNVFGGHRDYAVVTVFVAPANRAPVANDDNLTTNEDTPLTIDPATLLANDTDVDHDNLSVNGVAQPEHGDLWFNRNGTLSYVPDADYNGTDTFTYTISDGTESATVTITIEAVNDAPTANNDNATTNEDTPLTIDPATLLANDNDVDHDNLSIDVITQPENGAVQFNRNGTISYLPDADFNGTDTFTYTVNDDTESATATVTVTVNAASAPGAPVLAT